MVRACIFAFPLQLALMILSQQVKNYSIIIIIIIIIINNIVVVTIFVVTPCMLLNYSIITPTTTHI